MVELLNLEELGSRLRKVDKHLVSLLSQRMKLAGQVEEYKRAHNQPLLRFEIEDKRLAGIREWAEHAGINPNFASSILYFIIREACAVEIDQLQDSKKHDIDPDNEEEWFWHLKHGLLRLTEQIAPVYDNQCESGFFATRSYINFEKNILERELAMLGNNDVALDLGCATGRMSIRLANAFEKIIGYDISPAMIEQAEIKARAQNLHKTAFRVEDLENGIPQLENSVSLVVMNLGTASDIRNIEFLLKEIKRVLKPKGRFFLSFYNSQALFYRWFIPWPVSLMAEINLVKNCLDVRFEGKIYSVYARPYTIEEVKELMPKGLSIASTLTYPTIGAILPNEFFEEEIARTSIEEIDYQLTGLNSGAYILVSGVKE